MAAAPDPTAVSVTEIAKIAKEFMPYVKELAQWVIAEAGKDRTLVHHRRVEDVTRGRKLQFELWNVDDFATYWFEGLQGTARLNQNSEPKSRPVQVGPKNAIALLLENSGNMHYSVRFRVGDPAVGYPLIDHTEDNEDGIMGQRRLYVWSFNVKG
jgi:hypothetical protein